MIFISAPQGSEAWHMARAGVVTASTFSEAVETTGGLTEQQQKYFDAIKAGKTTAEALATAGYKAAPKSTTLDRALRGETVTEPSPASHRLAAATAVEMISQKPYGDTFETFAMRRGREEEQFARMRYEQRFSVFVDEAGLVLTDDRLFGYSTDGFVGEDGMIEIKVPVDLNKVISIIKTGDVSEYMHQMQGGMWITGRKWCDFVMGVPDLAALNNGNEIYVQRVYRDDEFIEAMEVQLLEFVGRVRAVKSLLSTPYGGKAMSARPQIEAAANETQGSNA